MEYQIVIETDQITPMNLQRHKMETRVKPFVCSECDKTFSESIDYIEHFLETH